MGPAAIASRWRHSLPHLKAVSNPEVVISFSRWLSEPPATPAFDPDNVQRQSVSAEPMFGLTKRVPRANVEREDLINTSSKAAPKKMEVSEGGDRSSGAEGDNYFSKAWAFQKNLSTRPWLRIPEQPIRRREFLQSNVAIKAQRQNRVWQYAEDMPQFTQEKFIIASYNILASAFARQHKCMLYGHVPVPLLEWKRRKLKIILELGLCSPDIICLQEVDRFKDLEEELAFKGYVGLYKARTGLAPDGCAIFWRRNRFKLLQEESLEFSAMGMRDNVAQFCVLESLVSGPAIKGSDTKSRMERSGKNHCLIVGNIHLLYNPKRGDIKLGQCRTFLEKAHMLSSSWPDTPIVIGGDFNSTPSSAIYDFIATSELEVLHSDRSYLSGQITKVANSACTHSKANGARESSPAEICASSQLKSFLLEAERSIEIPKSVRDSKVPHEQLPGSKDIRSDGIQEDDVRSSTGCSIVGRECIEDNANLSEEFRGSDGFGEKYVHYQSKVKLKCFTKSSFSSGQIPNHDKIQVKQMLGSTSETTLCNNLDTNTDIESTNISVKEQFVASKEHNEDLEVSNLMEERLHVDKLLSRSASDEQTNSDCSLTTNGEAKSGAVVVDNMKQFLDTSALNAVKEASNAPKLTDPSNCTSHGPMEENTSKSSDRLNLQQSNISVRNGCPLAQVLDKNPVEMNHDGSASECEIKWDLDELTTATGDPECTVVRHKLNLCSVYPEVKGQFGTRDGKGEPLVTTYNTMFMGTVDYIWRSDGLKPVRVLETVPPEGMLVHRGLPTQVWGSDHLAIACELAFTSNQTGLGSNKVEPGT